MGAEFRQALSARGLAWRSASPVIRRSTHATSNSSSPSPHAAARVNGMRPMSSPSALKTMLTQAKWRMLAWRKGTKGPLKARSRCPRACRRREPQRIGDKGMQHMPGDEVWLVGERRASGEQKYNLANLPAEAGLKTLAATIKARWVCERPPAAQGRTRPRPLRRPLMARSSSPCADGQDRLRLPAASSPRRRERGKEEIVGRPASSRRCEPLKSRVAAWPALRLSMPNLPQASPHTPKESADLGGWSAVSVCGGRLRRCRQGVAPSFANLGCRRRCRTCPRARAEGLQA